MTTLNRTFIAAFAMVTTLAFTATMSRADDDAPDVSKLPPASTKQGLTYDTDIKPIFDASCIKCHGVNNPKGKLNLTTLAGALKGSKDGKVIIPGKVDKSPLVFDVAHVGDDDSDFMPPPVAKSKVAPLTKEQVSLIRAWVEQGAK
jgi:hypothetical protein